MNRLAAQIGVLALLAIGAGFGLGAVFWLDLGTPRRMGPGFFPMLVGLLLVVLGLIVLIQNLRLPLKAEAPEWAGLATVIGSVASFAFVSDALGVIPGTALAVLIGSLATRDLGWRQRGLLGLAVAIGVWVVFVLILKMPLVAIRGV